MKALMNTLMTCAVLAMMSANALAGGGGGGAKGDGTIVVKNDAPANQILLVVAGNLENFTLTGFLAAGGQIVSPGDSASFDVPAGDTPVHTLFINDVTLQQTGNRETQQVTVSSNQTVNISATLGNNGA